MRLIAITPETPCTTEAECLREVQMLATILDTGFHFAHVRKPGYTEQQMRQYLSAIPTEYHSRLKLHSHFALLREFSLGGMHLNHRSPTLPGCIDATGLSISRSCHSLEELKTASECDYAFLSPIFDSISYRGCVSAFALAELQQFFARTPQCRNAVALGGVTPEHLRELRACGFTGAAFLGYIFNAAEASELNDRVLKSKSNV